jgi:hypothetical protein
MAEANRAEAEQSRDGPNKRSFGMKNRAKTDRFWNVGPVKAGSRQQTADSRQQTADSRQYRKQIRFPEVQSDSGRVRAE